MMRRSAISFSFTLLFAALFIGLFSFTAEAQRSRDARKASQLVEQGNRALNQQKYSEAIDKFAEALAYNPTNPAARFAKGKAHNSLNQSEMALMELNAALDQGYTKPIDVYLIRWKLFYDDKNFEAAQKDVDAALAIDPENLDLLIAQGNMAFAGKRYPQALAAYQRALQRQPNNPEIHLNIAKMHYMSGNVQAQGESAKAAIANGTKFLGEANLLLGDSLRKQRRFDEATSALQNALAADTRNFDIYQSLAEVYRAQNRFEDAIAVYRRGLAIFGADGRIYTGLSWYYSLAGRAEDAVEAARSAIRLLPNEYLGFTNLCRAYNDQKRPESAVRECLNALKLRPDDGETLFYLGYSFEMLNKSAEASRYYKQAVAGLEKATQADPTNSDNFYLLGNAYASDGQPKKAIAAYVRSLELTPAFARARYNLGAVYVFENNKAAAQQQYNALLPLDPVLAERLKKEIDGMK
ncbi:MAG: tetratricopeptide repeat protein [Pyrinomonadaceae bacterium]|nr:tetratricopeptide repeat protein [Pyrinomonadaceae bacterium]